MDISVNTKDLAQMGRNPWVIALVPTLILAGIVWLVVSQVVTREDDILAQGSRIEKELAESRQEFASGLQTLSNAFAESDRQMGERANRWIDSLDRLARISVAECYARAGDNQTMHQECKEADLGPQEDENSQN